VLPAAARATRWVDGLVAADAEVLARYDHPHVGRWPAVTTRRHGDGRITCVGTVPDPAFAAALLRWLVPRPASGWGALPDSVTATTARAADGRRVHVVHNWSWTTLSVTAPVDLQDVLTGRRIPAGAGIPLGAWDVRVAVEPEDRPV